MAQSSGTGRPNMADLLGGTIPSGRHQAQPPLLTPAMFANSGALQQPQIAFPAPPLVNMAYLQNRRDLPPTHGMMAENSGAFQANGLLSPVNVLSPPHNGVFNVDISQSNFNRAINFESLQNGGVAGPFNGAGDCSIEQQELEESEDGQSSVGEQNPLDLSMDMLEHQGAQEQARLLARFKQLRDWQSSQQQILMQQQQKQLDVFRKEQERVQHLIAKRQLQWGAPQPQSQNVPEVSQGGDNNSVGSDPLQTQASESGFSQTLPPAAVANMASPKSSNLRPGSTIPAALASGAATLARMNHLLKSTTTNQVQMVNGRPAPVLPERPETPEELLENGNPDLDSTLDTICTGVTEDILGISNLPADRWQPQGGADHQPDARSGSMTSMQTATTQQLEQLLQLQQLLTQQQNAAMMQGAHPLRMTAPVQSQTHVTNMFPSQHSEYSHPQLNGAYPTVSSIPASHPSSIPSARPTFNSTANLAAAAYRTNSLTNNKYPVRVDGHSNDVLDFRESSHPSMVVGRGFTNGENAECDEILSYEERDDGENDVEDRLGHHRREEVEDYEYHDDNAGDSLPSDDGDDADYDGEGYEDEDGEEMRDPQSLDDMPVAAVGGQAKTFEELLEEELRKEAAKKEQEESQERTTKPRKHTFLKRGEGIARFNAPPPRGKKPSAAKKKPPAKPPPLPSKPPPLPSVPPPKKVSPPGGGQIKQAPKATSILKRAKGQPEVTKPAARGVTQPNKTGNKSVKPVLTKKPPSAPARRPETSAPSKTVASSAVPVEAPGKASKRGSGLDSRDVVSVTDSVGEISFQNNMMKRAESEVKERGELDEFEILEQFADDNESFMSNLSAVERVLQDVDTPSEIPGQLRQVKSKLPNKPLPTTHESDTEEDVDDLSSSESGDEDDDEEVPSASDRDTAAPEIQRRAPASVHVVSGDGSRDEPPKMPRKVAAHSPPDATNHVVFSPTQAPLERLSRVLQFSDSESETEDHRNQHQHQLVSSKNDYNQMTHFDSQKTHLGGKPSLNSEPQVRLTKAVPLYTSATIEQQVKSLNRKTEEFVEKKNVRGKYNAKSLSSDEETSEEEEGEEANRTLKNEDEFIFDDDDNWDESMREDSDDFSKSDSTSQKKPAVFKSKVISGEVAPPDKSPTPPPTSQLVTKLFPNLRQEQQQQQLQQQKLAQERIQATQQLDPNDGAQARALREKLAELENEIEKFRSENAGLGKLRKEREEGLEKMQKEIVEFEKQKNDELKRIQEYKNEEMKKLKRERKLFDQYQKATRNQPDKKDRQEIEALKTQVAELQEEIRKKDARWTSSSHRLRDRIEQLEQENAELKEEIKFLEKQRLTQWQQKEAAAPSSVKEAVPQKELATKKAAFIQHLKSPKPEVQPKMTTMDNALRLSSDMLADDNDNDTSQVSEAPSQMSVYEDDLEPHQPTERSLRPSERPSHLASSPRKSPDMPSDGAVGKPSLSRKVAALPASISKTVDKGNEEHEEVQHSDGKVEKIYTNGAREILFANGTRKQISKDGQSIIVSFFNGDIKQILPDQRVVYFYADAHTTHTTYPDGLEILQFPNQQTEKHYPDGTKEITFPDHTIKYLFPSGTEESIYPDGTVIRLEKNGERVMEFPNGQREIHTSQYKRREYPDGTVKTVYPDGRQETRYSSGRIRVKDKEGSIIVDKRV